jgi:hypothetical protein
MTAHDWFDEHRMEYAMHLLDDKDTRDVRGAPRRLPGVS